MRSAIRISTANAQRPSQIAPRFGFVCLQCRQRASVTDHWPHPSATTTYTAKRNASSNFTEGLRKRIWGTSELPGQEDPYGDKSPLDRIKEEREKVEESSSGEVTSGQKAKPFVPRDRDLGPDYVPAASIVDLARLPPAHQVPPFHSFMAPSKMKTREEVSAAVHRAMIEVHALQEAKMPLVITSSWEDNLPELSGVSFSQDTNRNVKLNFVNERLREEVLESTSRVAPEENMEVYSEEDVQEKKKQDNEQENSNMSASSVELDPSQTSEVGPDPTMERKEVSLLDAASQDQSWCSIPLDDPNLKFAVLKRAMQLTGIRIPDPEIDGIKSANGLLGHLIKKPKPKKLAETLKLSDKLQTLPNLQIMDRRYTPIDKEKELGRWKIIQKELRERGLPVTGHSLHA